MSFITDLSKTLIVGVTLGLAAGASVRFGVAIANAAIKKCPTSWGIDESLGTVVVEETSEVKTE